MRFEISNLTEQTVLNYVYYRAS